MFSVSFAKMISSWSLAVWALAAARHVHAEVFNSFDGDGFPTCYNVTTVHDPTSVDESKFWYSLHPAPT